MNKYNPKINIKFLTHVSNECDNFTSELHIKKVYRKQIPAKTFSDKIFERNVLAFSFLKNIESMSIDSLRYLVSLFDKNYVFTDIDVQELIEFINEQKNDYSTNSMVNVFLKTLSVFKLSDKKYDLAIMLCNFKRIKDNVYPLIFYNSYKFKIRELLKNKDFDKNKLISVFDKLEAKTNRYNRIHDYVSLEDVVERIYDIKNSLINNFGIQTLAIYGSYSRNEATEYSDLDLLISLSDTESLDIYDKQALKEYLKNKLKLPVDVLLKHEIGVTKRTAPDMFDDLIEVF